MDSYPGTIVFDLIVWLLIYNDWPEIKQNYCQNFPLLINNSSFLNPFCMKFMLGKNCNGDFNLQLMFIVFTKKKKKTNVPILNQNSLKLSKIACLLP